MPVSGYISQIRVLMLKLLPRKVGTILLGYQQPLLPLSLVRICWVTALMLLRSTVGIGLWEIQGGIYPSLGCRRIERCRHPFMVETVKRGVIRYQRSTRWQLKMLMLTVPCNIFLGSPAVEKLGLKLYPLLKVPREQKPGHQSSEIYPKLLVYITQL